MHAVDKYSFLSVNVDIQCHISTLRGRGRMVVLVGFIAICAYHH